MIKLGYSRLCVQNVGGHGENALSLESEHGVKGTSEHVPRELPQVQEFTDVPPARWR